jgi:uncharacterized protein (DUF885 family)
MLLLLAVWVSAAGAQTPDARLAKLADRFVQQQLAYDPTISYSTGLSTHDHGRFADRTPRALAALDAEERQDLVDLGAIDPATLAASSHATYANLREQLESDLQLRVCKTELWNVNHFDGWPSHFAEVATHQPVGTPDERRQALQRWSSLPRYVDVEIANLRRGIAAGYSAPQSVVRRTIKQMDDLATTDPAQSPFWSLAARSNDSAFSAAFRTLIVHEINPALHRYRDYLANEYLPKAREGVAISDLPDGAACYQAFLRANTTLNRTPKEVFDLGQQAVQANVDVVQRLGEKAYGTTDIPTIVAAIRKKPDEHFTSQDDLLSFSRAFLTRTKRITSEQLIDRMPGQDVVIQPLPTFEDAAGVGSRFVQEPDPTKPAVYLLQLSHWRTATRAEAEIETVHETVPGHYLQKALARTLQPTTALSSYVDNAAYSEGWARYAEAMAEDSHIYDTDDAAILRRLWPAHGMVVDPGLHALHWTRQRAIDYMVSSGHFTAEQANDYVDRIAVMPGQLTSYDTGALLIWSLRHKAEAALGARFDLRAFNRAILEEGVVPLGELRSHVEAWINSF